MDFEASGIWLEQTKTTSFGQEFMEQDRFFTIKHIKKFVQFGTLSANLVLPSKIDCSKLPSEAVYFFQEDLINECKEVIKFYIELMDDRIEVAKYLSQLRAYNEYTFQHSLNVAILSGLIGKWLGYAGAELKELILTGLLHDVGKMLVPLAIINTPERIIGREMEAVKKHSGYGYELIKETKNISEKVKIGILQHHERLDGSGYPVGLFGDNISSFARIIAIADMYDAMTNKRVYRQPISPLSVLEAIAEDMNCKLDPNIGVAFLTKMRSSLTSDIVINERRIL